MSTTVAAYNVAFNLNAKGLIDSSKLARNEVKSLGALFRQQVTPAEKFEQSLTLLEKSFKSGAITWEAYRESAERLKTTFRSIGEAAKKQAEQINQATNAIKKQHTAFQNLSKSVVGNIKTMATGYIGLHTAVRAIGAMQDSIERIDTLANSAISLGESAGELQVFQFAMQQIANIDGEQAVTFLTRLEKSVGEASLGIGSADKNLARLGLTASGLSFMSPVEQFRAVADALRNIDDQTQRVAIATSIFGRGAAELLPILQATTAEYDKEAALANSLGLNISAIDVANIQEADDAINAMGTAWSTAMDQITVSSAPGLVAIADLTTGVLKLNRAFGQTEVLGFKVGGMLQTGLGGVTPTGLLSTGAAAVRDIGGAAFGSRGDKVQSALSARERFGSGIFSAQQNKQLDNEVKRQGESAKKQREEQKKLAALQLAAAERTNDLLEDQPKISRAR